MHDVDWLWQYHRTHHLTKHPNPLLTLYADTEQEIMDIAGIPLLTWITMRVMGMPMGFYEFWICYMYVVYSELFGHSGVRVLASPPSTLTWLLRATGTELVVEDHDLHHRKGMHASISTRAITNDNRMEEIFQLWKANSALGCVVWHCS
jgi:sterol desaturase/sphingolipid hydroxylase (fatty acid hydroxylase superfamily)